MAQGQQEQNRVVPSPVLFTRVHANGGCMETDAKDDDPQHLLHYGRRSGYRAQANILKVPTATRTYLSPSGALFMIHNSGESV